MLKWRNTDTHQGRGEQADVGQSLHALCLGLREAVMAGQADAIHVGDRTTYTQHQNHFKLIIHTAYPSTGNIGHITEVLSSSRTLCISIYIQRWTHHIGTYK